jgi:hypothetical protein
MADRARTFAELVAAEDPAERERCRRAEWFTDARADTHDSFRASVTLIEDESRNGDWRVEYFGRDKTGYVTIFADAERQAQDYFQALKTGALKIVREGTTAN